MKGKVSAAVLEAPYNLEVRYFDKPRLGPKDLLMKVKYCGICGSDIHLWRGDWNPPYPMILGHEFIGEVAEAGNEALEWRNLDYSDQIAVEMILPCNKCEWCLHGLYNLCRYDDRSVDPEYGRQYGCNIPISRPPSLWGGYAQYLFVPENAIVHKYERRVEWKEGALTEPLAVSVHAIKVSKICPEDSVAVVGPGTIGLMSVVAAKVAGAKSIILIGTRESRLKIGEALGADYLVNVRRVQNPVEEVKKLTNGIGVDVVIETAGTSIAQQQALRMAKRGGRVVL
ncbi:MAG: alcohol dehydrogenase catalytic domain-containing protein, partial [Candidatus Bathyarchaeia archaeon]